MFSVFDLLPAADQQRHSIPEHQPEIVGVRLVAGEAEDVLSAYEKKREREKKDYSSITNKPEKILILLRLRLV